MGVFVASARTPAGIMLLVAAAMVSARLIPVAQIRAQIPAQRIALLQPVMGRPTLDSAIGLTTPPVGTVHNVVAGVGRIKLAKLTRGELPFMTARLAVLLLRVLFPARVMVPARWPAH